MTEELKLLDCPFCGYGYAMPSTNKDGTHTIFCGHCIALTRDCRTHEEAVAAWNRRAADGWVSVADALPSGPRDVLAFCNGYIEMMTYEKGYGWYYTGDVRAHEPVTHWRPLPPPPEG